MGAEPQVYTSSSLPDQLLGDNDEYDIPVPDGGFVSCSRIVTHAGDVCTGFVLKSKSKMPRAFVAHVCSDIVFILAMNPSAFGSDIVCVGRSSLFHGKHGAAAIAGVARRHLKLNLEPEFSFMHSRFIGTVLKPCQAVRVLALRGGAWHGLRVKHTRPKSPTWMPGPTLAQVLQCYVENAGSAVPLVELGSEKSVALLVDVD